MFASVRAFLEGIIDYAGLFPPADLPLNQAMANYLRYRQEPEGWMLGRFICPAARVKELAEFRDEIGHSGPVSLAVLGRGGQDGTELLANVRLDLADIKNLAQDVAKMECYEVKLPTALVNSTNPSDGLYTNPIVGLMAIVITLVAKTLKTAKTALFFECPWFDQNAVDAFAAGLRGPTGPWAGWKLRCGGLQASAFPSPQLVARVLAECCSANIPWKATAGLHHPLRHFDQGLQTGMHGFINVFGAAILAHAGQIEAAKLEELLTDEDSRNFCFSEAGCSWKTCQAATDAIRLARQNVATSFGSCSFNEPRDDLRRLGWI